MSNVFNQPGGEEDVPQSEREVIECLVDRFPVTIFQFLNKKLNDEGFCLAISSLGENEGDN